MPLTDIQIKAFQPRDKRYLVSDGRGLSLDVLPSGFKSWIYRYTLDGKAEKVMLGPYPDMKCWRAGSTLTSRRATGSSLRRT